MGFKISGVGLDGSGMTLKQLAAKQGATADNPIMAAKVDNVLVSLDEEIEKCENIEFIDLDSEGGQRIYRQHRDCRCKRDGLTKIPANTRRKLASAGFRDWSKKWKNMI